ncbi:hypothetical protein PWT90_08732 [Aphanocladium album]|nr:hypothetical protein PWT90_08732 [Aphanocladium album]
MAKKKKKGSVAPELSPKPPGSPASVQMADSHADQRVSDYMAAINQAFLNPEYSDVKIYLGQVALDAHRLVLAAQSAFFAYALPRKLKEGESLDFHFEKGSMHAYWRCFSYIYTGDYSEEPADALTVPDDNDLSKDLRVYELAHTLEIRGLKEYSSKKFAVKAGGLWAREGFADCIRDVYTSTLGTDCKLRRIVVDITRKHPKELWNKPMQDLLREGGDFAVDLILFAAMYTASNAFFEAIWDAGVTHCFVNLGSDHPSFIEAMVKGQRESKDNFPRIITCPNEMVAMSMADGYARLTGKPQCVIVHVDVGTQALAAAVHNASSGRAPVLIFAGLSPFTLDGEHRGSRTEYIHWMQDVPDQKQILAQYCRYSGEIKTGANVKQVVNRALQFAMSDPQGPSYLCGAREIMEADIQPYTLKQSEWSPIELGGLSKKAVLDIADALAGAERPLVITGYGGRNHEFPDTLVKLATVLPGLQVLDTGGSDMCFPANHPAWMGMRFGVEDCIEKADVILVINCDVPWIPTRCKPQDDAVVFHIDVDPLKQLMPMAYVKAKARFRADAVQSLEQIIDSLKKGPAVEKLHSQDKNKQKERVQQEYETRLTGIEKAAQPLEGDKFGAGHLCSQLRAFCPEDTIWAIEAVTNTPFVHDNIRAQLPGSWINCGGGGLGWSGGGALGIKLATDAENGGNGKFVVQIVGDGTYMFSVPSSVYWISKRYNIPILTIVLNNKGWNAPRNSYNLVHPNGLAQTASNDEINIAFNPTPDYAGIARAAGCGEIYAGRVSAAAELPTVLKEAIDHVQAGKSAVLDCAVVPGC